MHRIRPYVYNKWLHGNDDGQQIHRNARPMRNVNRKNGAQRDVANFNENGHDAAIRAGLGLNFPDIPDNAEAVNLPYHNIEPNPNNGEDGPNMMKPFPNNGHLTDQQLNFNRTLSQCRVRVENAFGRAKGKWRRIKFLHVRNQVAAVDHITASFVLHNFLILQGEPMIDDDELRRPINNHEILGDEELQEELQGDEFNPNLVQLMEEAEDRGLERQLHIMHMLAA